MSYKINFVSLLTLSALFLSTTPLSATDDTEVIARTLFTPIIQSAARNLEDCSGLTFTQKQIHEIGSDADLNKAAEAGYRNLRNASLKRLPYAFALMGACSVIGRSGGAGILHSSVTDFFGLLGAYLSAGWAIKSFVQAHSFYQKSRWAKKEFSSYAQETDKAYLASAMLHIAKPILADDLATGRTYPNSYRIAQNINESLMTGITVKCLRKSQVEVMQECFAYKQAA